MQKMIKTLSIFLVFPLVLISGVCFADEADLFTLIVEPDAIIAYDLSGSMGATPWGDDIYSNAKDAKNKCSGDKAYGQPTGSYTVKCDHNNYVCSDSSECTGPYYKAISTAPVNCGSRVDCSKAGIGKRAVRAILDDDGNGQIQKKDQESLGIRLAYMRFKYCEVEDPLDYSSGCNFLRHGFQSLSTNNYYKDLYDKLVADTDEGFWGWTPLRSQLNEVKAYLNYHKSTDPLKDCRKKFVIFITDGWDTLACGHSRNASSEDQTGSYGYMRRRATIKAAKELADAGYKVFVIGFGADMPQTERYTLEWAAYFGGTDNPLVPNSGDTNAISIVDNPCAKYASCTPSQSGCTNAPNDPGYAPLTGYAYLANDANALNEALRKAMEYVKEARYSFTVSSVSAARLIDENYLYEASFTPLESDPFWLGYLKKYRIDDNGSLVKPSVWDAGERLRNRSASSRNMYTLLGGTIKTFSTSNITPTLLGVSTEGERNSIVGYFRGEASYNQENWKLGDIFHSNPITIGPPSAFYNDSRSPAAYDAHRTTYKNRERLVVVGANDGQFHAFSASTGDEKWSFIPPNLLRKLKLVSHYPEPAPTSMSHQFFVDGPVTASEVWLGSGNGRNKSAGDWRTLLIFGLGKGVRESDSNSDPTYLWSSSPSCDSGFKRKYSLPHRYYCGYYAFDVTDTSSTQPVFKWTINVDSWTRQGRYLDEPWSKMAIGRVMIDGNEKWVGFIGGGYNVRTEYDDDDVETKGRRGKGFFVIDLSNGNILWQFTQDDDRNMDYAIPASPAAVDWDSDGFTDTVYLGDLGGNMWRFRFCSSADYAGGQSCNTTHWKGNRLFASSTGQIRPIFTRPAVAPDEANQLWVFWGTGNKTDPTESSSQERFFALQDTFIPVKSVPSPPTYTISNLENLTPPNGTYKGQKPGWYINLTGGGEKVLSDPTVFGGVILFTTYKPYSGALSCSSAGTGRLYAMAMMPMVINGVRYEPGAGLWAGGERSVSLGTGIPTAPIVSQKPKDKPGATDVFVTVSGGGGSDTVVKSLADLTGQKDSPLRKRFENTPPQAHITHWRDMRMQ